MTYLKVSEAISLIAFNDCDAVAKYLPQYQANKTAHKEIERWEQLKARGFPEPEGRVKFETLLTPDIENKCQQIDTAIASFFEHLNNRKIEIRGVENGKNGNAEIVPEDFLLRDDIVFDLERNELGVPAPLRPPINGLSPNDAREMMTSFLNRPPSPGWKNLKVKKEDVLKLWLEHPERDYFNELKYAPERAAAKALKERQDKPFDALPVPDWREWGNIPMVPLWKVVALSLNVDPAALEVHGVLNPEFHGGLSDEFKLRLRVTIANQPALGIYTGMMSGYFHPSSYYMPVEVTRFFKWAAGIGWKLPAGFPNGDPDNAPKSSMPTDIIRTDVSQFPGGITTYDAEYDEKIRDTINTGIPKDITTKVQKPLRTRKKNQKQFKGKPGPKTKYPDKAYIKMRTLINSKKATSIREAARKVAPNYKGQSVESTAARLAQTYPKRIKEIAE